MNEIIATRLVLVPFAKDECWSIAEASTETGESGQAIRNWCRQYCLGRKIGGQWKVSRIALRMFLEGDAEALAAYHHGNRSSQIVVNYFVREGLAHVLRLPAFAAAA